MKKTGDTYALDRGDLIRINRLVRGKIDVSGYREWYNSISRDEQTVLAFALYTMAMQTGFHLKLWDRAVKNSEAPLELSQGLKVLIGDGTIGKLLVWLRSASDDDRRAVFPLSVHLFGESEAAVMALETEESCNHWWHRNILDPKVVADLMSNPNWSATSPKDDRKRE